MIRFPIHQSQYDEYLSQGYSKVWLDGKYYVSEATNVKLGHIEQSYVSKEKINAKNLKGYVKYNVMRRGK